MELILMVNVLNIVIILFLIQSICQIHQILKWLYNKLCDRLLWLNGSNWYFGEMWAKEELHEIHVLIVQIFQQWNLTINSKQILNIFYATFIFIYFDITFVRRTKNVEVLYIIQYASRYCKLRAFFINWIYLCLMFLY